MNISGEINFNLRKCEIAMRQTEVTQILPISRMPSDYRKVSTPTWDINFATLPPGGGQFPLAAVSFSQEFVFKICLVFS